MNEPSVWKALPLGMLRNPKQRQPKEAAEPRDTKTNDQKQDELSRESKYTLREPPHMAPLKAGFACGAHKLPKHPVSLILTTILYITTITICKNIPEEETTSPKAGGLQPESQPASHLSIPLCDAIFISSNNSLKLNWSEVNTWIYISVTKNHLKWQKPKMCVLGELSFYFWPNS